MFSAEELQTAKKQWEKDCKTLPAPAFNEIGHVIGVDIGPKLTEDEVDPKEPRCLRFYVERKIKIEAIGSIKQESFRFPKGGKYKEVPTDVIEIGRLVPFQVDPPKVEAVPGSSIGLDHRDLPPNVNPG